MSTLILAALLTAPPSQPPNVLLILADDLGYSDLGCYGGEIETPTLDALAAGGLRYTQFYNTARCWPTRAALLTGYYPQAVHRDGGPDIAGGARGQRQTWAPLLPERLKAAGYRSLHSGKWHLDKKPLDAGQGFDRSYLIFDQGRYFHPQSLWLNDEPLPAVEKDSGFYATTAITDRAIEFLTEHLDDHADRPFFQYLAYSAPHFPLHAPAEDIARYKGRYDAGWDVVRKRRAERQRDIGLLDTALSAVEPDVGPPYAFPDAIEALGPGEVIRPLPWDDLTDEQKAFQADKMEIHAAMVDRMDREIGRVIGLLRDRGVLDNTLVLFLSDNGASAEIMIRDDGHDASAPRGSAASYLCLGPGWSTCCNTPFRRHKTWVHEGGVATPLLVSWPAKIADEGRFRRQPGHVVDIAATLMAVTGVDVEPEKPWHGADLSATLTSDEKISRPPIWWLHEGNRAVRDGNWKLVAADGEPWELYDLSVDRAETVDHAAQLPKKAGQLEATWARMLAEMKQLSAEPGRP